MKIAVIGATGFIGHHVLCRLQQEGAEITAVGRNRDHWNGIGKFVELDLSRPKVDHYDAIGRPSSVIHLAWGGLPNYQSLHHFETELRVQYDFLRNLIDQGLPHLLVTGTCYEYGMQDGCLSESHTPSPVNPYGFAKNSLQQSLRYLCTAKKVPLTWARLFYLWGERQGPGSLYPSLVAAIARGDAIFNMSGGEQIRDYLDATSVADILVRLTLRGADDGVVNVCSGRPVSVAHVVEQWIASNNWCVTLNKGYYPYPAHEPMAFWGDRSKLDALLAEPSPSKVAHANDTWQGI